MSSGKQCGPYISESHTDVQVSTPYTVFWNLKLQPCTRPPALGSPADTRLSSLPAPAAPDGASFFPMLNSFPSGSSVRKGHKPICSLRTQGFLPGEKVLREGRARKLSALRPTTPNSAGKSYYHACFLRGKAGDQKTRDSGGLNLRLDQENGHPSLFLCDRLHFRTHVLHEVELGLTPKCILHVLCYQSRPAQYLWASARPFLSSPHTLHSSQSFGLQYSL